MGDPFMTLAEWPLNFRRKETILPLNAMETKKLNERAKLDVLLKRLLQSDGFMPSSIDVSERPDFIITVADKKIGVEVTLLAYAEHVRASVLQNSNSPFLWVNTTHFRSGPPRRTNAELAQSIGYGAILQPWRPVEAVLLDWKRKTGAVLSSKRQKLNQPDYEVFDRNWLLFDDYPPLSMHDLIQLRAEQHLSALFWEQSTYARDFDKVFVHSGDCLFCWHEGELLRAPLSTKSN